MENKIIPTLEMYKTHIEDMGYHVHAIMLKGSQNYGLADDKSDIDANAILIPTPSQIRRKIKKKFTFADGEVTCHDIYEFADILRKGNPQWVEVCNTEYKVGGDLSMFADYEVNPSALKGMMMQKVYAFDTLFPSREVFVKEFGYDPKQLHHIIRLYDILEKNVRIYKYEGTERDHMIDIKRGRFPDNKEDAFALRDKYVAKIAEIYEKRQIEYKPQAIDYPALDEIVMSHYLKTYAEEYGYRINTDE